MNDVLLMRRVLFNSDIRLKSIAFISVLYPSKATIPNVKATDKSLKYSAIDPPISSLVDKIHKPNVSPVKLVATEFT